MTANVAPAKSLLSPETEYRAAEADTDSADSAIREGSRYCCIFLILFKI